MKPAATLLMLLMTAPASHAALAADTALRHCTQLISNVERLACFDAAMGTPPSARPSDLIRQNESSRPEGDSTFMLTESNEPPAGQQRVVMSAPALNTQPPIYLAITCLSNISRLQLLADRPFARHQMTVQLYMDDRPLSAARPWRVLPEGNVADAGRGLVAIDQLRPFVAGERLRVESDYALFNGLTFNASGLQVLLSRQREACHW
ncbi:MULTISPECIES: type VI secretion system-associated protein TagO [Achromobacter]|uniref:Type VI secretion system-associated protein TagO n=1 Tax=Achromobacter spanius TaxID=217203 RepID=A0ABY8GYT5_9BURK|nr:MULTISPECIES: type VI secretion system-associated protein TagO [Achromobacter]WAI86153.1 type VI secretion protein [Achromobacter spanius]WEX96234.1 type VI secretion protein [Achromobacter sp. SS2-2022]WFP10048.1 type VI secretion system-associated protein TagO [Achromobacter spanius]